MHGRCRRMTYSPLPLHAAHTCPARARCAKQIPHCPVRPQDPRPAPTPPELDGPTPVVALPSCAGVLRGGAGGAVAGAVGRAQLLFEAEAPGLRAVGRGGPPPCGLMTDLP